MTLYPYIIDFLDDSGALEAFHEERMKDVFSSPRVAASPLTACQTLDDLRNLLSVFDGSPLRYGAKNMVFSDGDPNADLVLVGEAPGADEDEQGKPFVGMSGKLLDKMLGTIGIDRTSCYITNLIPWRPPGNRTPSTDEIATFLPFLHRHLELLSPKIIVLLGGVATKSLLKSTEGIMKLRGRSFSFQTLHTQKSYTLFPTFHPAYLLRSPGQKLYAWRDWLRISEILGR